VQFIFSSTTFRYIKLLVPPARGDIFNVRVEKVFQGERKDGNFQITAQNYKGNNNFARRTDSRDFSIYYFEIFVAAARC